MNLLKLIHGFGEWARVIETQEVDTVRFDDISEISNVDYLKIDTQGSELTIFENDPQKLSECAVIHTEVEFVPMYEEQPLFAEVDQYRRSLGFVLHRFCSMGSRALKPMTLNQSEYSPFSQVLWTDAVYVKDFMKLVDLPPGKLLAMAIILHDIYRSYDLVLNILSAHDALANTSYAETFISALDLSIINS